MSNFPPSPHDAVPGRPPLSPYPPPPPPQGRSVAFFVALFLGFLLLISGALNVLLLVVSIGSVASGGLGGGSDEDGANYEIVTVGGDLKAENKILRVVISGAIAEGSNPVIGAAGGTVTQVRRALKYAAREEQVRGVLLAIDSPGGGVTDSDEIYRLLRDFKAAHPDKKVEALFGDLAASGGYYVAAASDWIMARRTSITGSIGVIMSSWNFGEAAKKYGIAETVIKSERTPMKDILSPMRPMTDAEHQLLLGIVDELYDQFLSIVDEGRPHLDRAQVQALATGAVYTSKQALQNGLIDAIGDEDAALDWFRRDVGKLELVEYRRRPSLRETLFGVRAPAPPTLEQAAVQLLSASTGPRFLYWWSGAR